MQLRNFKRWMRGWWRRSRRSWTFEEAAAVPLVALTAWELLFERMGIDPDGADRGKALLVINGAGGVGSALIPLARSAGLRVVATASRPETVAWCKSLGADEVINHREPLRPQAEALGIPEFPYIANLYDTEAYWETTADLLAPLGTLGLIVETVRPGAHRKSVPAEESAHCLGIHARAVAVSNGGHAPAGRNSSGNRTALRCRGFPENHARACSTEFPQRISAKPTRRWKTARRTASGFYPDGDFTMTAHTETFSIRTHGKGTTEITREVAGIVARSGIRHGTVTVFVRHTSASLVIMENADPSARRDLEMFFEKLVPENTPWFIHTAGRTGRHAEPHPDGADADERGDSGHGRADDAGDLAGNFPVRAPARSASPGDCGERDRRMS